jgi:hypothetical protein
MDILHHPLKHIKASHFGVLDFLTEITNKVFQDNTVASCKEPEDVFYEILFVGCKIIPVLSISRKVNLLGGPEGSLVEFIRVPYILVLDREQGKSISRWY